MFINDVRSFAILTSLSATTWLFTFVICYSIGLVYIGHIPVFGVDGDPGSISLLPFDGLYFVNVVCLLLSFVAMPAWVLLMVHLLLNNVRFSRRELLYHSCAIFSLVLFFIIRLKCTNAFDWFYD